MFELYKDYKKYKKVADKVWKVAGFVAACRYVANTAAYYKYRVDTAIPTDVRDSFPWVNTTEGWDYWNNIADKVDGLDDKRV